MHHLAIVGAGPVGATLALALATTGRDIVVLDARAQATHPRGDRSLALSHGGRLILERLGVWGAISATPGAVTPITAIDISQARGFGNATLTAAEAGVPALGYVVSAIALQAALDAALARTGIAVRYDAKVTSVTPGSSAAGVFIEGADAPLAAGLVVIADGSGATVAGIERVRHDYGQVALIADVERVEPQQGVAYERFTADGPVALLPKRAHFGLVWTLAPARAAAMLALADAPFLAELARHAGRRIGAVCRVAERRTFPLTLEYARPAAAPRVLMLGNAAQTLHPVAGQGFNVGLRDAFELAHDLVETRGDDWGAPPVLHTFVRNRRPDRRAGIAFTHGLARVFGNDVGLVRWPRGIALSLLDVVPPAKRAFTRAMLFGVH